jgi:para-aminobenzoate synthetase component 1
MPFTGGAAGFFSYELGAEIERLPGPRCRDLDVPDLELGFYDSVVGWNHRSGECFIVSTGLPLEGPAAAERAARRADRVPSWIGGYEPPPLPSGALSELAGNLSASHGAVRRQGPPARCPDHPVGTGRGLRSGFTRRGYENSVREAIEKIRAGDIFQVNLSQRFTAPEPEDPVAFYLELRSRAPAPFGAWFRGSRCSIASASPERFVRASDSGQLEARPIKGTRPRGADAESDRALAADLLASEKDRAENLMIADLLRNDLSRICLPGTVRASNLFGLESYAAVHHLVSVIEGRLKQGLGPVSVLQAMFPCGSVTGAPKVRAMEIIAELEPVARGPCYGSVGWIGFDGRMDLSVAIRTAVIAEGRAAFHAGGAVVADSIPAAEYDETLDKARALASSLAYDL